MDESRYRRIAFDQARLKVVPVEHALTRRSITPSVRLVRMIRL
jgi:hypothetical protein